MKKFTLLYCVICILLLVPFQAEVYAATDPNESVEDFLKKSKDDTEKEPVVESESNSESAVDSGGVSVTIWDYVKMIFALLFVILLLYGLLRFVNSRNKTFQTNQLIQNLGGMGISQGKSVQLLQVGNSLYLVGIGDDVSLLKEITDPEEIEKLTKMYEEKQEIGKAVPYFMELFTSIKDKRQSNNSKNTKLPISFNETFQKRLQEIKKDRSDVLKEWKTKEREENE